MVDGTCIVRLRFTLLLTVSWTLDVLRVPVGPPLEPVDARATPPWKKFRLCRFMVTVVFEPVGRLNEFSVADMLKSVATIVRTIVCDSVPSLAITVIR